VASKSPLFLAEVKRRKVIHSAVVCLDLGLDPVRENPVCWLPPPPEFPVVTDLGESKVLSLLPGDEGRRFRSSGLPVASRGER
jgi:hypothetical protein